MILIMSLIVNMNRCHTIHVGKRWKKCISLQKSPPHKDDVSHHDKKCDLHLTNFPARAPMGGGTC